MVVIIRSLRLDTDVCNFGWSMYSAFSTKNIVKNESTSIPSANKAITPSKVGCHIPVEYNKNATRYTEPLVIIA